MKTLTIAAILAALFVLGLTAATALSADQPASILVQDVADTPPAIEEPAPAEEPTPAPIPDPGQVVAGDCCHGSSCTSCTTTKWVAVQKVEYVPVVKTECVPVTVTQTACCDTCYQPAASCGCRGPGLLARIHRHIQAKRAWRHARWAAWHASRACGPACGTGCGH